MRNPVRPCTVRIDGQRIESGDRVIVETSRHGTREAKFVGRSADGNLLVQFNVSNFAPTVLRVKRSEVRGAKHDSQRTERAN